MKTRKEDWNPDKGEWIDYPRTVIESSNLSEKTKEFLKDGFPNSAAPYLGFDSIGDTLLESVYAYYEDDTIDITSRSCIMFGSDAYGDMICIDPDHNDRIVILNHEEGFQISGFMNSSIEELYQCLKLYRVFIKTVNEKYGSDGFFEGKFKKEDVLPLEEQFRAINPNILLESDFWSHEIEGLKSVEEDW